MPEGTTEIIASIAAKLQNLQMQREQMRSELDRMAAERNELRHRVDALTAQVSQLKADLEFMEVTRAVAPTPEQTVKARHLISGLVREIDRCISDLKAC